jgi:Na+-driven multidrug efflux pump
VRVAAVIALVTIVNHAYATEADQTVTAAFGIGVRLDMLIMFGAMGWGAAAATYVGQNLGAEQPRRAATAAWIAALYAALMMSLAGTLMWFFAPEIVAQFAGSSAEVAAAGTEYLRYLAPSYPLAAAGVVLASALNGAGSVKAPAVLDTLAYGLLILPLALGLVVWGNAPTTGLWAVIAGGNALLAVSYVVWFRRGSWQRIAL